MPEPAESVCPSSSVQEPSRLQRKTFLIRKRSSSSSLRPEAVGEGSTVSSPTSPQDGSTEAGSTSEDGTGKHRLQRQMAQSRKTFRFMKSRYGKEVQATSPDNTSENSISHINVEPSQVQQISTSVTSPAEEAATIRQLQVPLIPEEDRSGASSPNYLIPKSDLTCDTGILTSFRDKKIETLEMQVRSVYRQNLYRDNKTSHDESTDTVSYQSQTPDSSQTSRCSSAASRKHVTIDPNLTQGPYERRDTEQQPYAYSQFVHPSGQVSVIPSISYRREEGTTLRYAREYKDNELLRDSRFVTSGESYHHPAPQAPAVRKIPTFYDQGPNYRHSWADGEEVPYMQNYPRESGAAIIRDAKLPQRKTGIRYSEPPILIETPTQVSDKQSRYQLQKKIQGDEEKFMPERYSQQQVIYTSEVSRPSQSQPPIAGRMLDSQFRPRYACEGRKQAEPSSHYGRESYRQVIYSKDGSKLVPPSSQGVLKQRMQHTEIQKKQPAYLTSTVREHFNKDKSVADSQQPVIISGAGLPEGTKRFVVDKFTVTFTSNERDEEDTLI